MKHLPIGVFDSGIGGLTVVKAIEKVLPCESVLYFGDLAHLPYGSKGGATVKKISRRVAHFLYNQGIKLLVIACNTATSIALEDIQKELDIPVIGVISPGAGQAVFSSTQGRIGVIGTTRTIVSNAYYDTIIAQSPASRVFQLATPMLVPLIENGWIGHPAFYLILEDYLKFFDEKDVDSLVLGCTHYPLIKENINIIRPHWNIVDSAQATAIQVAQVLKEKAILASKKDSDHKFFASDISETFVDLSEKIMGQYIQIKLEEGI